MKKQAAPTPAPTDYSLDEAIANTTVVLDGASITAMRRADLDRAADEARANPRQITKFREELTTLATGDEDIAASCTYSIPRGRTVIEGPSVRFAEMVVYAWPNLETSTFCVSVDDHNAVVRARVVDLERNTVTEMEASRTVHKKKKNPKPDADDKQIAVAVATSIAFRNAVFRAVPRALWWPVYQATLDAAEGKGTMTERREKAIKYVVDKGKKVEDVLARFGRSTIDEITATDLRHLRGLLQSVKDNLITLEEALRPPDLERPKGGATAPSRLASKLQAKAEEAEEAIAAAQSDHAEETEAP